MPFDNVSTLAINVKGYIAAVKPKFFGIRAYEKNYTELSLLNKQLNRLKAQYPIDIYYGIESEEWTRKIYSEMPPAFLSQFKKIRFNLASVSDLLNNNIDYKSFGACVLILDNVEQYKSAIANAALLRAYYLNVWIFCGFELHGFNFVNRKSPGIRTICFSDKYLKADKSIFRIINIFAKDVSKNYNLHCDKLARALWARVVSTLKKIDKDIDFETTSIEARLKAFALLKPVVGVVPISNNSFQSIKGSLEKYMRDTALDFQKKLNTVNEENFNPENGSLTKVICSEIENLKSVELEITSTDIKDILEVKCQSGSIQKFQFGINDITSRLVNGKIIPDIEATFNHIYEDINKELTSRGYNALNSSTIKLVLRRKLDRINYESTLVSDYIGNISYYGRRGPFILLSNLRRGVMMLFMTITLLTYLNPVVDSNYYSVRPGRTINVSGSGYKKEDNRGNPTDQDEKTVYIKQSINPSVPQTLLGKWFGGYTEPGMTFQSASFAYVISFFAIILVIYAYFEYEENLKSFGKEEGERHLRTVKNELKGNVRRIAQNINRSTREFVNECFADLMVDLSRGLEMIKNQVDEKESDAAQSSAEGANTIKYFRVKLFELDSYKKYNRIKLDEFDKFKF